MIIENGVLIRVEESDINEDGSFIIPEWVNKIGDRAFMKCRSLQTIEIPEGITEIGSLAFAGCNNLNSVMLPKSLARIGNGAFGKCRTLTTIEIPENVTQIDFSAFRECSKLKSIKLPSGLTQIGENAFRECSELEMIEIPEGVTQIGMYAFSECTNLKSIKIPEEVVRIADSVFRGCSQLVSIKFPRYLEGIDDNAFMGCSSLKSIELPEDVHEIGKNAFRRCNKLISVKLPKRLSTLGNNIFYECDELQAIEIPDGITQIGKYAFAWCTNLMSITLPDSLATIDDGAFLECSKLQSIEIPNGVSIIQSEAFMGCSHLNEIDLPDRLIFLGNGVFKGCESLKSVKIPEGVITIGSELFLGCRNLVSVKHADNVKYTGSDIFEECDNLTSIYFSDNIIEIWENAFNGCSRELKVNLLKQNKNVIKGLDIKEQNDLTFLSLVREDYRNLEVGSILKKIIEQGAEDKYRELEELEKRVSEKDKEKILKIIWQEKQNLKLDENLEEQLEEKIQRISKWLDKGFIPPVRLYEKIPANKIEIFDKKIWFDLAKEPVFNISDESKMALVELAYTFGVFEKDVVELRGQRRNIRDLTLAERRNGEFEDNQKRTRKILELVQDGKLTNENLHIMFDGTDMKFKPEFYRFFIDNIVEILENYELMQSIPKIQREMEKIVEKYRGQIPTPEECIRYFAEIEYDGVKKGNKGLAELCKLCGISQESFEIYQEIYEEQKKRKESTIPTLKGKGYEILDLDDPKTLLIGEGRFSECCQRLNGAGEECMRHSAYSENGRIIEILDDDGTLIAQSWMWRNGNVVCFDSIEANAIESEKYSDADRKRLINKIEKTYREVGKELIEESEVQVELFRKKKLDEIEKMEGEEKERALQVLEEVSEESKIKRVTVGKGFWPISQKITDRFSKREVSTKNGRIYPIEAVDYLDDSDIQYIVAEAEEIKEIKTYEARVEVKYRDKRSVEKEEGMKIHPDTIARIIKIEQEAHKEQMQLMEDISTVEGLSSIYETKPERMKIIAGEDWYLIYSEEEDEIHIHDLARGKTRFEDEDLRASKEILEGIDKIIEESITTGKDINAEMREDTSYLLMLRMKERGLIEQIGEDIAFEFDAWNSRQNYGNEYDDEYYDEYDEGDNNYYEEYYNNDEYDQDTYEENYDTNSQSTERIITEEEQKQILSRSEEIREEGSKSKATIMHRFKFRPTEKYKERLEKRKKKDEVGGEI